MFGGLSLAWMVALSVPLLGWILAFLVIPPVSAVLWLLLMFKAYQGERFKLPGRRGHGGANGSNKWQVASGKWQRPRNRPPRLIRIDSKTMSTQVTEAAVLDALQGRPAIPISTATSSR